MRSRPALRPRGACATLVLAVASKDQRSRGGGRGLGYGLLAVLVALLVAYLGRCLPGFGTGGAPASGPPQAEDPAVEAAPEPAVAEASDEPLALTVRGDSCVQGTAAAVPCESACDALSDEPDKSRPVVVNAAHGTHAAVERLRTCLEGAGFSNVVVRTE